MDEEATRPIRDFVTKASAVWPGFDVDRRDFEEHVARIVAASETPREVLKSVHGGDLFMAFACGRGDPAALRELERVLESQVAGALRRLPKSTDVDDAMQCVRTKLLVGDGTRPKILDYEGRGPLSAWLKITAIRTAIDRSRRQDSFVEGSITEDPDKLPAQLNQEFDYIRLRYAAQFKAAFARALAELDPADRNMLRWRFVDGLTADAIAALLNTSRATVFRRIAQCREAVQATTRRLLADCCSREHGDLVAVLNLVPSQFDTSIHGLLASTHEAPAMTPP